MSELSKNMLKNFADSKIFVPLHLANTENTEFPVRHILTAHKAEFLRGVYFGNLSCLPKQGTPPSFLYTDKFFSSEMANTTKKLNGDAQGASISTHTGGSTVKNSKKHYYLVNIRAVGTWSEDYRSGLLISRILRAVSKDEAVGMLCNWVKAKYPQHTILARDISCDTFNYINPKFE